MDRMMVYLSAIFALSGRCSLTEMPSTLVGIGLNLPRYFSSASGFGSHVSIWLIPPADHSRITERSLALPVGAGVCMASASPRQSRPKRLSEPTCRNVRLSKSFSAIPPSSINIGEFLRVKDRPKQDLIG